jgi:hypothetical protein
MHWHLPSIGLQQQIDTDAAKAPSDTTTPKKQELLIADLQD